MLHGPNINIYAVFGIIQDWTMNTKISRDCAEEWIKPSEIAEEAMDRAFGKLECIRRASEVVQIQRQRALASANAERRWRMHHKLALDQVDVSETTAACAKKQVEAAEAEYLAACAEYNDERIKLKS